MKDKKVSFGRVFWPSLTASIIVLVLIATLISIIVGGVVSSVPTYSVGKKAVLHMTLKGNIGEVSKASLNTNTFSFDDKFGLADILYGIEKASNDDRVEGLFIELEGANFGYATAKEIRDAINRFEAAGKFVVAYNGGEAISLKEYYVASAADEIYGFHSSVFEFLGLGTELVFFKGMFDKLDLEMQVIRGANNDFKSAVEPFFRKEMSDSSRLQLQRYLSSIWSDIRQDIGEEREIDVETLDMYADSGMIRRVSQASEFGLINKMIYRDEVMMLIAEKIGVKNIDDINVKGFKKYAQNKFSNDQKIARGKNANIAVIVAEGDVIVEGDGLSSKKITKLIQSARKDEHIKTIVLRINSPGGSALASDEIWREVKLANEEKKVIVSMGDVAASGGYYIATPADRIFAESTTITGSIGVFGVIPYTGEMLENKIGLTFDRVSTNKHAVMSTNKKLSDKEYSIIQEEVDLIYQDFLNRVAEGRGMSVEDVNQVARGRVWTGKDALKVGLIDEIGGLQAAIDYAAKDAGIENKIIEYYPHVKKEAWIEVLESIEGEKNAATSLPEDLTKLYKHIKSIENFKGVQARLPYIINW
jgi:protease-4